MSQKTQPTAMCRGTGLIKKLTVNRRGEMKGTLRMLTPIDKRGELCTFFVRDVKVSEEELDYVQIGMTLQYYYSGNEVVGYRATQLKLIDVADYSAFVIQVPTASSNADPNKRWNGLLVSLDLTLDAVHVSANSLRALFTNADTGEVEPCTIQPGDRCLVQIKSKDWIQANMKNKDAEWQIISFLPSNSTVHHPHASGLEAEVEPSVAKEKETVDSAEGKEKSNGGPAPSFNYCSSTAPSLDTPPSELSPQHKSQPDETQGTQGAKACSFPQVDGWRHLAPPSGQGKSIGQADYGMGQRDPCAECDHHCRRQSENSDNPIVHSRRSADNDCALHHQTQPLSAFPLPGFEHQEKLDSLPAACCDQKRCKGHNLGHLRNQGRTAPAYIRKAPLRATSYDGEDDGEYDEEEEGPPMLPVAGGLYGPGGPLFPWVPMHDAAMCDTIEARTMAAAALGHRPINSFFPVAHPSFNYSPRAMPFGGHFPHAHPQFCGKAVVPPMRQQSDEPPSNHETA